MADGSESPVQMPGQVEESTPNPEALEPSVLPEPKRKNEKKVTLRGPADPFTNIEERLDLIIRKLDEGFGMKQFYPGPASPLRPKEESSPLPPSTWPKTFPSEASARTTRSTPHFPSEASSRSTRVVFDPPRPKKSMVQRGKLPVMRGKIPAMQDNWSLSEEEEQEYGSAEDDRTSPREETRRMVHQVRAVDLKLAWQMHAKVRQQELSDSETDATRPVLRLLHRSRADQVWELLDDQNSSLAAWCLSQFLKLFVVLSVMFTNFQTTEEPMMNPAVAKVIEFIFDTVFLAECLLRLLAAPSKRRYVGDWLNWADILAAFGLPFRIAFVSGSVLMNSQIRATSDWNLGEVGLLFILPLIRLMKLLRYFDSFRLLLDACINSAEALPVLTYCMAIITWWSATGIYLVEKRSNIPSMQHSLWLSLVTMTTVGYGDYYPTSLAGYIMVSALTIVSVLFLSLPVGIIGYEFTACWQQRNRVLLLTRAQKCLAKWGYTASDVKVLFEFMDVDGDGNLNLNEFMELFHQMRIGITTDSAVDLFQMFDDDQSGTIEYDEFLRHIFPEEYVKGTQKGMSIQLSRSRVVEALQYLDEMRNSDD